MFFFSRNDWLRETAREVTSPITGMERPRRSVPAPPVARNIVKEEKKPPPVKKKKVIEEAPPAVPSSYDWAVSHPSIVFSTGEAATVPETWCEFGGASRRKGGL